MINSFVYSYLHNQRIQPHLDASTVTIHGLSGNKRKRIYENQRLSIVRQKIHNLSYFWPDFDFNKSTNRIGGVNPIMMRLIISTAKRRWNLSVPCV